MIDDPKYFTSTIAKIYSEQGYLKKASRIYKHILEKDPSKKEARDALLNIKKKLLKPEKKDIKKTIKLLEKWVYLLFEYKKIQRLKKINKTIKENIKKEEQ